MPRIPRGLVGGGVAHVLNRGNARSTVFESESEYTEFITLLDRARSRFSVELYAFCLMPNHFHLVARAERSDLSRLMQWWLTAHVRRRHKRNGTTGHIWQGRFKSFPVQQDEHLLTLLRYVLLNPCRAGLVRKAQDWRWTSLHHPELVSQWPVRLPVSVDEWLGEGAVENVQAIRESISRGTPFGDSRWRVTTAEEGGLASTLRPRGRPRADRNRLPASRPPAAAGAEK